MWVNSNYVSSDHFPLCVRIKLESINIDNGTDQVSVTSRIREVNRIKWCDMSVVDHHSYRDNTDRYFKDFKFEHAMVLCDNVCCNDSSHISAINDMYDCIVSTLLYASSSFRKDGKHVFNQVEGWNEHCKQAHSDAREAFLLWRLSNSPKQGLVFDTMRRTRSNFKLVLRNCKSGQLKTSADTLALKFLSKDSKSFWKDIKKHTSCEASIASTVNGISGQVNIADMWHDHFKNLLNSSQCISNKPYVLDAINSINNNNYLNRITPGEILDAFNNLKLGKSPGLDGLYAEHFKFASDKLSVLLSILINAMLIHGHLPSKFMETVILPIIKNKRGDITNKDNYRPIAITNVFSKVFEAVLLHRYSALLVTTDNQFGFRNNHSTDMCMFAFQQVVDLYVSMNSPVYICYLDASKAFDRINHWTLFKKLLHRSIPVVIIRIIMYWYTQQTFVVQWGSYLSSSFMCSNGVRQGGILSPIFFNIYVDELSCSLTNLKTGCNINNIFINHFMYADDTVLIAPSPVALQKLINCCLNFAKNNDMLFNTKKSV